MRQITNNCATGSTIGYLKVFSLKEIYLLFSNLALDKFLGQGQTVVMFLSKISRKWFLAQLLILSPSDTFWVGFPQSTQLSELMIPSSYNNGPLNYTYNIKLLF